jgi:hypothetical protein
MCQRRLKTAAIPIGRSQDTNALISDYWSHARRMQSATISCYHCDCCGHRVQRPRLRQVVDVARSRSRILSRRKIDRRASGRVGLAAGGPPVSLVVMAQARGSRRFWRPGTRSFGRNDLIFILGRRRELRSENLGTLVRRPIVKTVSDWSGVRASHRHLVSKTFSVPTPFLVTVAYQGILYATRPQGNRLIPRVYRRVQSASVWSPQT